MPRAAGGTLSPANFADRTTVKGDDVGHERGTEL